MRKRRLLGVVLLGAFTGAALAPRGRSDEGVLSQAEKRPVDSDAANADSSPAQAGGLTVDQARDRATVMQDVYKATLVMLHDRYFHRDKSILPARAMQDIFSDLERQSNITARWISASLKPMSIDHAPGSEFEKRAAREIAAGASDVEAVEDGYYRRGVAIPLTGGCLGCHEGVFQNSGRKKFAGLVVSIPLSDAIVSIPGRTD